MKSALNCGHSLQILDDQSSYAVDNKGNFLSLSMIASFFNENYCFANAHNICVA